MKDEITQKILEYVNKTEMFVQTELPVFISEYLAWHFWSSVVGIVIGVVLLLLAHCCLFLLHYFVCKKNHEEGWVLMVPAVILIAAGLCSIISNTYNVVKVTVAPRVYIVDKLTN